MRPKYTLVAMAGIVAMVGAWVPGRVGVARAQEGAKVGRSVRGGLLARTGHNQFEVFFYPTGVRVFPLDASGAAIDASALSGIATFYHPSSADAWFARPIQGQGSLDLAIGMGTVPTSGAKVAFEIAGLPESSGSTAEFTVPVQFAGAPVATAAAPSGTTSANPPFVFGPGFYGVGYYQYPGPQAAPVARTAPAVLSYSTPARQATASRPSSSARDWSTGRRFPSSGLLSKPWLRPS